MTAGNIQIVVGDLVGGIAMSRTRWVLLVIVSALLPAVPQAAPLPKEKPPELYYPTKKGTTWTMRTKTLMGGTTQDVRYEILESKQTDNEWLVTVGTSHDKEEACKPYQKFIVSGKGVFEVEIAGMPMKQPCILFTLPEKNREWTSVREFRSGKWTTGMKVVTQEKVETPYGELLAVKVALHDDDHNEEGGTVWWAQDRGVIRHEHRLFVSQIVKTGQ
jgi:hypothetical protein